MDDMKATRIELLGPRPLWTPRPIALPARSLAVRFETALCDRHGRVERVLQRGTNTITNWGMDTLASVKLKVLHDYLNLSSTADTRKRVLPGGNTLTVTYTSPSNVTVVAAQNFFEAADVGRTLSVPNGGQELKITAYTDPQNSACVAPQGEWVPGFTPPGTPPVYGTGAVYYTNNSFLATWFTKFNTYDTSYLPNPIRCITDNSNSRFIHERVYLSGVVSGSDWTINQLGWSNLDASNNCFGIANLASADIVPIGKRYRVKLQIYSQYTPIDLVGVAVNWGGVIGSYTFDIRQEYMGSESGYGTGGEGAGTASYSNFLEPHSIGQDASACNSAFKTAAHTMVPTYWQYQSGGTPPSQTGWTDIQAPTLGAYTAGQFMRTKNLRWTDSVAITAATALGLHGSASLHLTFKPQTGTVTKPSGYWCDATFKVFWTRDLPR
jgi:hypothetical protein